MSYRLSEQAEEDVVRVYVQGTELFGVQQAVRYHRRLRATFELLAANPRMARERAEYDPPVRIHPVGSHVVVYVVDDRDEVLILRIRHGREDWAGEPE